MPQCVGSLQLATATVLTARFSSEWHSYVPPETNFVMLHAEVQLSAAAILICHGVLNTFGTVINAMLNAFSSIWHMVGVVVIVIVLPAVAVTHQSGKFVFTNFQGPSENAGAIDNSG